MRFTVATYNIHKGFSQLNRRMVIHELRERLAGLDADILFLQEVVGVHERHAARHGTGPRSRSTNSSPTRAGTRSRTAGPRSTATAITATRCLSRYPITAQENIDISAHPFESRGLLHCEIRVAANEPAVHCINVHLGLFERGRRWQIRTLCERIRETVPMTRRSSSPATSTTGATRRTGCWSRSSACTRCSRRCAAVRRGRFPSVMPVFRLDRIYARGLAIRDAHVHYTYRSGRRMSDHAALAARFDTSRRPR